MLKEAATEITLRRHLRCSIQDRCDCLNIKQDCKFWTPHTLKKVYKASYVTRHKVVIKSVANAWQKREKNGELVAAFKLSVKNYFFYDFDQVTVDESICSLKN